MISLYLNGKTQQSSLWSSPKPPTPEKRDVVYRPLRFPHADRQDSHGSGMPEQLPPNLGEKQDPWANLEVLPSLHVASVVQVSLLEHW